MIHSVEWRGGAIVLLDQRLLPNQEVYRVYRDHRDVARAIREMVVRGAPAVAAAAAMGIALAARGGRGTRRNFDNACNRFAPLGSTATHLPSAIQRMRRAFAAVEGRAPDVVDEVLLHEALSIRDEYRLNNQALAQHGESLLPRRGTILTHGNAGTLASCGCGSALGVVRAAREAGKRFSVLVAETRPCLEGARLTAWELKRDKIPVTVITDGMCGHFFQSGKIDAVIVGADRIAANGDTASKIGTYTIAVLAAHHGVPFYVASTLASIDERHASGDEIPLEQRPAHEVARVLDDSIVPRGVKALHPACDLTPGKLISAIITEHGVAKQPYKRSLARLLTRAASEANASDRSAGARSHRR